jgi:NifB/MoaA-like Fe-S oxidoreductase
MFQFNNFNPHNFQKPVLVVQTMPVLCTVCAKTVYQFIQSADEHKTLNETFKCFNCQQDINMIPEETVEPQEGEDFNLLSTESGVIPEV